MGVIAIYLFPSVHPYSNMDIAAARWDLLKNAAFSLEQILKVTLLKKAAAWSLASYFIYHFCKTNMTCGSLQEKQK